MLLPGSVSPPDEPEVKLTQDQRSKRTAPIPQPISRRYCQRSHTSSGNDRGGALTLGFFSSPAATIDVWEGNASTLKRQRRNYNKQMCSLMIKGQRKRAKETKKDRKRESEGDRKRES
ncbi:hypothetical protein QQF64_005189 [Cirrhinus molitorella]|uniref:Uncharacterized protein n=1 Tax=Cirrhinus molitorella TaxID=172907 RepID=A0ABR3MKI5_9TELE